MKTQPSALFLFRRCVFVHIQLCVAKFWGSAKADIVYCKLKTLWRRCVLLCSAAGGGRQLDSSIEGTLFQCC